jgi:hypothetical protein
MAVHKYPAALCKKRDHISALAENASNETIHVAHKLEDHLVPAIGDPRNNLLAVEDLVQT